MSNNEFTMKDSCRLCGQVFRDKQAVVADSVCRPCKETGRSCSFIQQYSFCGINCLKNVYSLSQSRFSTMVNGQLLCTLMMLRFFFFLQHFYWSTFSLLSPTTAMVIKSPHQILGEKKKSPHISPLAAVTPVFCKLLYLNSVSRW